MNAIIIDDNEKAANELKRQLKDYPDIQVVGMAQNSFDGLALADDKRPDVIFLDVEMPGITGLDFLDRVPWVKEADAVSSCSRLTTNMRCRQCVNRLLMFC